MSEKFKHYDICTKINSILHEEMYGFKKQNNNVASHYETKHSSDKFDCSSVNGLSQIIPILIVQSFCYFSLKEPKARLPKGTIKNMKKEWKLINKYSWTDLTKYEYEKKSFVVFNDNRRSHPCAFKYKNIENNILIKLTGQNREHYRMGIEIKGDNIIILVNICNKKSRNNS